MNISVIGLGKLGLPLACCLASGGNKILGIDKDSYVNNKLRGGLRLSMKMDWKRY
jgi:UDP-N-acetyl-D-mannosaminuronate dehydrogenase